MSYYIIVIAQKHVFAACFSVPPGWRKIAAQSKREKYLFCNIRIWEVLYVIWRNAAIRANAPRRADARFMRPQAVIKGVVYE